MEGGWSPQRVKYYVKATSSPAVTDDINSGYKVSDVWINEATDEAFRCVDNGVGAAVWVEESNDGNPFDEIVLTPKASSVSTAEGTIFYCSGDNHVYVGVE